MPNLKVIVNLTRGTVVCEQTTVADRPFRRMRGLLGRRELPSTSGMLLRPAPAIHSAFMRFAVDALFLDSDLLVMHAVDELRPWRVAGHRGARAVLELAGGQRARRGVEVGDRLALLDDPDERVAWSTTPVEAERDFDDDHAAAPDGDGSMRVLLAAADKRFRHTASMLLTRRGCTVIVADVPERAVELAVRDHAQVVVLDAGSTLTAAARVVATLEALSPPVGVVVVADKAEQGLAHLPVLDRWGSFDSLFAAIEDAHHQRCERRSLVERD